MHPSGTTELRRAWPSGSPATIGSEAGTRITSLQNVTQCSLASACWPCAGATVAADAAE